jgi:glycerophosphoryl diester phosphodiesterase
MRNFLWLTFLVCHSLWAFDWQGHRGARGLFPENTIEGMKVAVAYPISTLELDVVISKDQQVVVSHEPWINPEICLTDKKVNIYELTYEQIKKFDCGSKVHPRFPKQLKLKVAKPLLADLIRIMEAEFKKNGKQLNYNIEIKSSVDDEKNGFQPQHKTFAELVVKTLSALLPVERYTLQSFDWRVLKHLHKAHPNQRLVALREEVYPLNVLEKELGFMPEVFSPEWALLKAEHVDYFHSKKVKVIPWTVNTSEEMKKMLGLRVDGIITDYPDLITGIPGELYLVKTSVCTEKENFFEGKCVRIPTHAKAYEQNPGWVCKKGYQQKRNSCVKIKIPKDSHLLEDGKTWVCNDGFERYRHRCRKIR